MVLNITLSLWLVRPLSFGGLALANSIATTLEMVLLLWLLRRRLNGINGRSLWGTALRSAVATGVMVIVLEAWVLWIPSILAGTWEDDWIVTLGGIILGIMTYSFSSWLLRSEELALVLDMLRRRGRRAI
jgi:putative peptidoglycan lipid II flippase